MGFYEEFMRGAERNAWRQFYVDAGDFFCQPQPPRGPKHAVRPPWAPTEPEPLEVYPALLPGLVDLAEQAGMVVEIR